jgi:hypothetical protein
MFLTVGSARQTDRKGSITGYEFDDLFGNHI